MRLIYFAIFFIGAHVCFAQTKTIQGYVTDSLTRESLVNANIYTRDYKHATSTNNFGFFSLNVPETEQILKISYVGYTTKEVALLEFRPGEIFHIKLTANSLLQEINVKANTFREEISLHRLGINELSAKKVENLPGVLGEPDILRAIQNMPGVQSGNLGTTGLFVRGADPGQSLILLDGVPLYNINHLYGIYSVFNGDALNSAVLYKGGFPARYGGRSSAILDVTMREGRSDKIGIQGSLGILASHILIEGPLIKNKLTFLVSARRTYFDLFSNAILKHKYPDPKNRVYTGYHFYDATCKINYRFNDQHRIFASFYGGNDFLYNNEYKNNDTVNDNFTSELKWGNATGTIRYNYTAKNGLFLNAQVYSTHYFYSQVADHTNIYPEENIYTRVNKDNFKSNIRDYGALLFVNKAFNNHDVQAGFSAVQHNFKPSDGTISRFDGYSPPYDTSFTQGTFNITDLNAYAEDKIKLGEKFTATFGLRLVLNDTKEKNLQAEPRIQLQLLATDNLSFKTGYARVTQNSFLISTNSMISPADLWVFKTQNMKPLIGNQVDFGVTTSLFNEIKMTFETYYKKLDNVPGVLEGKKIDRLDNWETNIVQGQGEAYGFESMIERRYGKINGFIGYTLAYSNRQFKELNNGRPYRFKYDRRHNISVVVSYKLTRRLEVNAVWNFASGSLVSLYTQKYKSSADYYDTDLDHLYPGGTRLYAASKNNYELPPFHQLDLGFTFTKQKKRGTIKWNYGIYNVYNRVNPFYITIEQEHYFMNGALPILPYVSYTFKF